MATEKISGVALGSIAVGSLFVYAAITGKSVLASVQAMIKGESPSLLQNVKPITGPVQVAGSTNSGNLTNVGVGNQGPPLGTSQFAAQVLAGIGAPDSAANQRSIAGWVQHEGGGGRNNPLNTTLPMPGSTSFNSVNVQNYVSPEQGVSATIATLEGGNYGDILMLLRSGQGLCGQNLQGLSTWSGGGYSNVC